jgi:hypothetical protein
LYTQLLPYVEQGHQTRLDPRPVPIFLCPSRRGPSVGPKADYAASIHPDMISPTAPRTGWRSVLGPPIWQSPDPPTGELFNAFPGASLTRVSGSDGASSTLMMAHKALPPSWYEAAGFRVQDGSWSYELAEHLRSWVAVTRDADGHTVFVPAGVWNKISDGYYAVDAFFGSSHPSSMPSLFADGSVRSLSYAIDRQLLPKLWAWNDGSPIPSLD